MKKIKHIITALDLSPLDEHLLSFAKYFGVALQTEKVTGLHIVPVVPIGDIIKVEAGHFFRPVSPAIGVIEAEVENLTKKSITGSGLKCGHKIIEGLPFRELLNFVENKFGDLLILGKKESPSHSRITTNKVVRNIKCDVLIVPEDSKPLIEKIVVPIDFSANSGRAIERAIYLSDHFGATNQIECVHVLDFPRFDVVGNDPKDNTSLSGLSDDLLSKLAQFKEQYCSAHPEMVFSFIENNSNSIAHTLHDFAKSSQAQLLVMGAQGHNIGERLFFGSVAESMVNGYFSEPIYIVR